jgi:hypothetical protein
MMLRTVAVLGAVAVPCVAAAQAPSIAALTSRDVQQLTCAPVSPSSLPDVLMRVTTGTVHGRTLFSVGDPLIIDAGTAEGLRPGQRYYVRRVVRDRFGYEAANGVAPISVHTVGAAEISQVNEHSAVATVMMECDGVILGDYLEPFVQPSVPQVDPTPGAPDFSDPAHIILGDERRQMGAAGSVMLIDRGSDAGLHAGQLITLYRQTLGGQGPDLLVGTAVIANVHAETALIRISSSRDAVYVGDLAAIHRIK